MNPESLQPAPSRFRLRPETPDDEPFLFALYASTRQEELDAAGFPAEARRAFLMSQFQARAAAYAQAYPDAVSRILVRADGRPLGRIVVARLDGEFRVVDIALLPEDRGRGIGTRLLLDVQQEAARAGVPVRLHVLQGDRALHLYERLGFVRREDVGIRHLMEWRPAAPEARPGDGS